MPVQAVVVRIAIFEVMDSRATLVYAMLFHETLVAAAVALFVAEVAGMNKIMEAATFAMPEVPIFGPAVAATLMGVPL